MKLNPRDVVPLCVLFACAVTCVCVTLLRSRRPVESVVWYGPMPHPYLSEVLKGVEAEGRESGSRAYTLFGQEWTQDNESVNVEALASRGHKGFSIYPVDAAGANGLFEQLARRGQFVVAYGAEPQLPTSASFTVATDIQGAAEIAAEELIRRMGGRGGVLNVLEAVTDLNTQKRDAGVRAAVARHPDVKIVQTIGDMAQVGEATSKIQSALAARADEIDGIIVTGFNPTVAAASVLTEWHKDAGHHRIRFVGIDTDPTVLRAISDGSIDATIAQNTFCHGYLPCALLRRMAEGWRPAQPYRFIDSGVVIVDRSNLSTYAGDLEKITQNLVGKMKSEFLTAPRGN